MKKLILVLLLLVSTSFVSAQNAVNIKLTDLTPTNCQITLYPTGQDYSILSNVVFTLRWKSTQNIALGDPQPNNLIAITKAGPAYIRDNWKYQTYSGCGFDPNIISQPIILNVPKTGNGKIDIINDKLGINNEYYVSIGGQDVTGDILYTKEFELIEDQSSIILYFDPLSQQFYIKREGTYYDMVGHKITLYNISELVTVRKSKL